MTLSKGWINRQFARVERDAEKWPDWMRRETALRAQEQQASATATKPGIENEAAPAVKKTDGA